MVKKIITVIRSQGLLNLIFKYFSLEIFDVMLIEAGGPDPPPPPPSLKNHKTLGFLSNTGPYPLKNSEATKPTFNVGPFQCCFVGSAVAQW